MVVASAPAKVILFGEHFVVYGKPALVTAIDKRAHVSAEFRTDNYIYINSAELRVSGFFSGKQFKAESGGQEARDKLEPIRIAIQKVFDLYNTKAGLSVKVSSSIPVAAGLGSSAAVATATAAAVSNLLGKKLTKKEIFHVAHEAERYIHGTPSGIDPAVSTYGGVLLFYKDKGYTNLEVEKDLPLVVGNTGLQRSTGELVAIVRKRLEQFPSIINPIIEAGGKITLAAVEALKKGDYPKLGKLMNINHSLLSAVGVSNETLERCVHSARKAEALGAKLTGAGGGGCIVALSLPEKLQKVIEAIESVCKTVFVARKTNEGVKIDS